MTGNVCPAILFTLAAALLAPATEAGEVDPFSQEVQTDEERARAAAPELGVAPAELQTKLRMGETAALRFTVRNVGGRDLGWSVQQAPEWLSLETRGGTLKHKGEVTVLASVKGAALNKPGVAAATLVVVAPGAKNSPWRVPIKIEVLPPLPVAKKPENARVADPEEEFEKELREEGGVPAGGVVSPSDPARPRKFGIRGSMLLPGGGSREDYSSAVVFGLLWRPDRGKRRLGYEVEVSYGETESVSGLESSRMISGAANAVWHLAPNGSQSFYALGGVALMSEAMEDEEFGSASALGSVLNLGAGATFAGRYDARVSYSLLIGSENVSGMTAASFGVLF